MERSDAWRPDEDQLLASIVIANIREGSSQLRAFQEAGARLRRTAGACGFRWNSTVRKQYSAEIAEAKVQRKQLTQSRRTAPVSAGLVQRMESGTGEQPNQTAMLPLDHIVQLAEQAKATILNMAQQMKQLEAQIESLQADNFALKAQLEQGERAVRSREENQLLELLRRAKEMGILKSG